MCHIESRLKGKISSKKNEGVNKTEKKTEFATESNEVEYLVAKGLKLFAGKTRHSLIILKGCTLDERLKAQAYDDCFTSVDTTAIRTNGFTHCTFQGWHMPCSRLAEDVKCQNKTSPPLQNRNHNHPCHFSEHETLSRPFTKHKPQRCS